MLKTSLVGEVKEVLKRQGLNTSLLFFILYPTLKSKMKYICLYRNVAEYERREIENNMPNGLLRCLDCNGFDEDCPDKQTIEDLDLNKMDGNYLK